MNFIMAFLSALPALEKLLTLLTTKYIEWEAEQGKSRFKSNLLEAIKKGDQRQIDGGNPSGHAGVRVRKPK